jgi:hypothetical protein
VIGQARRSLTARWPDELQRLSGRGRSLVVIGMDVFVD